MSDHKIVDVYERRFLEVDYDVEDIARRYKRLYTALIYDTLGVQEIFPLLDGNKLPLKHELFDQDAIILSNMPKKVILKSKKGRKSVCVEYCDMDYLGLWHKPKSDAPYICIEPWSSLPSRKDVIEDLACQNNLKSLQSGDVYHNCWSIAI